MTGTAETSLLSSRLGFLDRLGTAIFRGLLRYTHPKLLALIFPQFSLRTIAWIRGLFWRGSLPPNFNTPVEGAHGLRQNQLMWFCEAENRQPDDPILFLLHGGGYVSSALLTHASYPKYIYDNLGNDRLSIAWLDYTLAPEATYPGQLKEAAISLNTLATSSNNIILGGDSAGGHLALQLLRHIVYPVDGVARVAPANHPRTVILNSPLVDMRTDKTLAEVSSIDKFDGVDWIHEVMLVATAETAVPDEKTRNSSRLNPYNDKDADWDKVFLDKRRVFISYASHEVLQDSILEFVHNARLREGGATIYKDYAKVHVSYLITNAKHLSKPVVEYLKSTL